MFLFVIFALSFLFSFFPLVTEKDEKTCFHAKTNDFYQGTVCGAPICWSKYTTYENTINQKHIITHPHPLSKDFSDKTKDYYLKFSD